MVSCKNLLILMKELQVLSEYMHTISCIYEKILCKVCMGRKICELFLSNIGINKQEHLPSSTLFGLLIDELE